MRVIPLLLCLLFLTACATQPGKPGTPLPPQNKAVGEKWAPEVRQFIDALLTEFQDGKPAPTVGQIEKAFGVKAVAKENTVSLKASGHESMYELQNWVLRDTSISGWAAYYSTYPAKRGMQNQVVTFNIDSQHYCINPYDFNIYSGLYFAVDPVAPFHESLPLPDAYYKPSYTWGVFERSPSGQYMGIGGVGVWLQLTENQRCIKSFKVSAAFKAANNL